MLHLFWTLLSVLACQHHAPASSTNGVEPAPVFEAPSPRPTDVKSPALHFVTVHPHEIRYDDNGTATLSPDSAIKSPTHTQYVVPTASLLGGHPTEMITLQILVDEAATEARSSAPSDPRLMSPDGGYRILIHHGVIVASP